MVRECAQPTFHSPPRILTSTDFVTSNDNFIRTAHHCKWHLVLDTRKRVGGGQLVGVVWVWLTFIFELRSATVSSSVGNW